jgi:uncharacterized protein (TIGR02231 family)
VSEAKSLVVSSTAERVTFFEDRARVERRAKLSITEAGMWTVKVEGISVLVDDPGLVVRVVAKNDQGQASLRAAQVRRLVRERSPLSPSEVQTLEATTEASRQLYRQASSRVTHLELDRRQLAELDDAFLEQVSAVPDIAEGAMERWRETFETLVVKRAALEEELHQARQSVAQTRREYDRQSILLNAALVVEPRMVAQVETQLDVTVAGELELVLEYFVPCAVWRPSHVARLERGQGTEQGPRIELTTCATVWQATGEVWTNVKCVFSTARLSKPSSAPLLSDDLLYVRAKRAEERKVIQVEARDQAIVRADADAGTRAVDEMPGIDDGGRPLVFETALPVTIPSDGEPFRVEVGSTSLAAKVEAVAYPERASVPHLRAAVTWSGAYPLLAGPIALMREREYVGQSRTDFVGVGDAFHLGFGPEGGVSLKRRVDESQAQSRLTGKQTLSREVHLYMSNLGGEARSFELVERVPVSEIDEVVITFDGPGPGPDRDGFVRIPIKLGPNEVLEKVFAYRVEYPSRVELHL